ncbi:DUF3888 domain-containing protein [Bacillus niameyensis]|uniref:DUF3888 domain-containing protein n=1 Tax=Bacillus niameyensis TaxID=1522308 RepID=UPI0007859069|nr:DUF3888 domain-containing protein [Bacillus niameyensis]
MKKSLLIFTILIYFSYFPAQAETVTKNDVQLRDDVILVLLFPSIDKELEKQFGKSTQYYCAKILQVKRLEHNYHYNITVQLTTFEGAHSPPFNLVTITLSNELSMEFRAIKFKSTRLNPNEIIECKGLSN